MYLYLKIHSIYTLEGHLEVSIMNSVKLISCFLVKIYHINETQSSLNPSKTLIKNILLLTLLLEMT